MTPFRTAWLALVALAATAACSGSMSSSTVIPGLPVTVGSNFFKSTHNPTQNPAVDTVAVGDTVTWVWTNTGGTPHGIESDPPNPGDPSFTSSAIMTGAGSRYTVVLTAAGENEYDCVVHGSQMTGTIVVQ